MDLGHGVLPGVLSSALCSSLKGRNSEPDSDIGLEIFSPGALMPNLGGRDSFQSEK